MPQDSQRTLRGEFREGSRLLIWNDDGNDIRLGLQIPRLLLRFATFKNILLSFPHALSLLAMFSPGPAFAQSSLLGSAHFLPAPTLVPSRTGNTPHPLFCSASSAGRFVLDNRGSQLHLYLSSQPFPASNSSCLCPVPRNMYPETPPAIGPMDLSRPQLKQLAGWIRDDLDPAIARDGPDRLRADDVLTLHEIFQALRKSTTITALDLRATGIHRAVMEVSGIATRWPGRLADDCDKIIAVWTSRFGRLEDLHPFMYGRGGRLEGIVAHDEFTRAVRIT